MAFPLKTFCPGLDVTSLYITLKNRSTLTSQISVLKSQFSTFISQIPLLKHDHFSTHTSQKYSFLTSQLFNIHFSTHSYLLKFVSTVLLDTIMFSLILLLTIFMIRRHTMYEYSRFKGHTLLHYVFFYR
jgi:hypothetical protein